MERFDRDILFWNRRYNVTPIHNAPNDMIDHIINDSVFSPLSIRYYKAYFRDTFAETIDFAWSERMSYKDQETLFLYMAILLGQRSSFIITHNLSNKVLNILTKYEVNDPLFSIDLEDFNIINDALIQASNGRYIIPTVENDNIMAPISELIQYALTLKSYGSENAISPAHLSILELNLNYLRNFSISSPSSYYERLEMATVAISRFERNKIFPPTVFINWEHLEE